MRAAHIHSGPVAVLLKFLLHIVIRLAIVLLVLGIHVSPVTSDEGGRGGGDGGIACTELFATQLCCAPPAIDSATQQPANCRRDNTVSTPCFAREGVRCDGRVHTTASGFSSSSSSNNNNNNNNNNDNKNDIGGGVVGNDDNAMVLCDGEYYALQTAVSERVVPCVYTGNTSWHTALALSVFTGWLGLDRFYLGYYAMGLAKLTTCGFLFVGQLVDIILIASQVVGPADGTAYHWPYYGPRPQYVATNDATVYAPGGVVPSQSSQR